MYFDILPIKLCNLYLTSLTLGELATSLINWEWQKWRYIILKIAHKIPHIFLLLLRMPALEGAVAWEKPRDWHYCVWQPISSLFYSTSTPTWALKWQVAIFQARSMSILVQLHWALRWWLPQTKSDWNYTSDSKKLLPIWALPKFIPDKIMNKIKW